MLKFRKTRDGKWAAFGSLSELKCGPVTVHKADGSTKQVTVNNLSRGFMADGVMCAFGFLAEGKPLAQTAPAPARQRAERRYECPECGDYVNPGTVCWETGCMH